MLAWNEKGEKTERKGDADPRRAKTGKPAPRNEMIDEYGEDYFLLSCDVCGANVKFHAFSDTDTIRTWLQGVFDRIFRLWNGQLAIAYRLGTPMAEMVRAITGEYPK